MSNEKQTIHEFDLKIIYDYFSNTERQGPGSHEITLKALSFIDGLNEKSKIADIGCGTGGQTMVLAQNTTSEIIGVELWPDFIKQFNDWCEDNNFRKVSETQIGKSMNEHGYETQKKIAEWYNNDGVKPRLRAWVGIKWVKKWVKNVHSGQVDQQIPINPYTRKLSGGRVDTVDTLAIDEELVK